MYKHNQTEIKIIKSMRERINSSKAEIIRLREEIKECLIVLKKLGVVVNDGTDKIK